MVQLYEHALATSCRDQVSPRAVRSADNPRFDLARDGKINPRELELAFTVELTELTVKVSGVEVSRDIVDSLPAHDNRASPRRADGEEEGQAESDYDR